MISNVINYAYHLVFGRVLGPVDYGSLASIYSVLYIISIVPSSTSVSIVKFVSSAKTFKEKAEVFKGVKRLFFWISVALSLAMIVISPSLAKFLNLPGILPLLLVSPIIFLSLICLVNQAASQANLKFSGYVIPNIISSVVKLVLGIFFVFLGWKVAGAIFGVVLAMLFAYLSSTFYIKDLERYKSSKRFGYGPFLKYSFPALLQALAFTSLFTTDVILVKHFFDPFSAGIYAAVSTLGKVIYFAATPIAQTMFPIVSGRKATGVKYHKVFYASLLLTMLFSFGTTLIYFLFPEFVVSVLYGSKFVSASEILPWMGLAISFYTVSFLLVNLSLSIGETKVVYLTLVAAALQIIGIFFFHSTLLSVIQITLITVVALCFLVSVYLIYNRMVFDHEKE